jgi:hypothetical protein
LAGTDDEHDPEGATIAFERQHLAALVSQARRHLAEIDAALRRLPATADRLHIRLISTADVIGCGNGLVRFCAPRAGRTPHAAGAAGR